MSSAAVTRASHAPSDRWRDSQAARAVWILLAGAGTILASFSAWLLTLYLEYGWNEEDPDELLGAVLFDRTTQWLLVCVAATMLASACLPALVLLLPTRLRFSLPFVALTSIAASGVSCWFLGGLGIPVALSAALIALFLAHWLFRPRA